MPNNANRLTPEALWQLPRVGAPVPAPDGSFLIVPVTTFDLDANKGTTRLYQMEMDGSSPRPLTAEGATASAPTASPDGSQLAFLRKAGDPEYDQLHVMPLDGGEARAVTQLPLGAFGARWLPSGDALIVGGWVYKDAPTLDATAERAKDAKDAPVQAHVTEDRICRFWDHWLTDGKVPHLFHVDLTTGECRDLTPESTRWFDWMDPAQDFDVAPDGLEVAFAADVSESPHKRLRWAIFTVPVAGGPVRCLTPEHPADAVRPRYDPTGRYLVYGMQEEWDFYADRMRLVLRQRQSGCECILTEQWDRSAAGWEWSPDGKHIVFQAEDRGRTDLYTVAPDCEDLPRKIRRGGNITGARPTATGFATHVHHALTEPPEVWRAPLGGGEAERLTRLSEPVVQSLALGEVEEIEVQGAGGTPIQAFVVYPPEFDRARQWPLVHLIHGGPHGIFGDQFHFRWNAQAFAAQGYVVACVNFHGSTSFGQDFTASILGAWGDKPLADIEAVTDSLIERGFIDSERMAVAGGSYGGYLTAWITTQTQRYACAVCHAGVFNLDSMYASDITQGRARSMGGEPWVDPAAIHRFSPAAHTAGLQTPTLVIHGELDYRVPLTQGLELYGILKAKGVPARLVHYPDENHWILKPQNSLHWYGEVFAWLKRYLGAGASPTAEVVGAAGESA